MRRLNMCEELGRGWDRMVISCELQKLPAATNAYQKTSNAIGKAITKNKVKLQYGTFVYLVNGREKQ